MTDAEIEKLRDAQSTMHDLWLHAPMEVSEETIGSIERVCAALSAEIIMEERYRNGR